ncbi:MAG: tetratricopeptide repeat protein [Flavobacteriales bacterium]|nr:tetratricopeptide repeat protein [Flavobacteriales bacterium]
MKKRLYILALFVCLISESAFPNFQTDSLRLVWGNESLPDSIRFDALDEYYEIYIHVMPDSVLLTLDYYYDLATRKNADRQIYRARLRRGNIYRNQNKYQDALSNYKLAKGTAQKLKNSRLEAIVIGNLGNIYLDQNKYFEAIQYYNEAKNTFSKENDFDGEGRMLTAIGAINSSIGNYELALTHYNKALIAYSKTKDAPSSSSIDFFEVNTALISMNIGLIHFKKKSYRNAEAAFNDAIKKLNIKHHVFYIKDCYLLLSQIKLGLNEVGVADVFATKSLELNQQLNTKSGILSSKVLKAQIQYANDKDNGVMAMESLINQVSKSPDFEMKKSVYEFLYNAYKHQEKWEPSLNMHELLLVYSDSLEQIRNSFKVVREAVQNEYEAKLVQSQIEHEQENATLKVRQVKRSSFMIVFFIVVILIVLGSFFLRTKKNTQQRNRLLDEINFLKNQNLTVVSFDKFELNKEKIDRYIDRVLNETDWAILQILLDNPMILNKEISEKVLLSVDGVGSSLRRMYDYFEIRDTKYKKIALLNKAIKISKSIQN